MHTSLHLLIAISLLAGFFRRPFNMFVFGKAVSLAKYTDSKPLIILLLCGLMLSTIYFSVKLFGLNSMGEPLPIFLVSFVVGGTSG